MVMHAQAGTAMPEGNGDMMEEMPDTDGRFRKGISLSNSLTKGVDGKDSVLCKTIQSLSHNSRGLNSISTE